MPNKRVRLTPPVEELVEELARKTSTDKDVLRNIAVMIGVKELADIADGARKEGVTTTIFTFMDIMMLYTRARIAVESLPVNSPTLTRLNRIFFVLKEEKEAVEVGNR